MNELIAKKIEVDAVFIDSKFASRKDKEIWHERTGNHLPWIPFSELKTFNIPFYFVDRHDSEATALLIKSLEIDLLINGVTHRILKKHTIKSVSLGILNVHPGILPFFKGCTCVEWAVYLDEKIGNTVHYMNEKIDDGGIIESSELTFNDCKNYSDLRVKVYRDGFKLMATCVDRLLRDGSLKTIDQGGLKGNYFKVIDSEKMKIVREKINKKNYKYQNL
mgnify:CR=1 FL=1